MSENFAELFELFEKRDDLNRRIAEAEDGVIQDENGIITLDVARQDVTEMGFKIEEIVNGFSNAELDAYADYRRQRRANA